MKTIHKYSLDATHADKVTVMMPVVATIVMVGSQDGHPSSGRSSIRQAT